MFLINCRCSLNSTRLAACREKNVDEKLLPHHNLQNSTIKVSDSHKFWRRKILSECCGKYFQKFIDEEHNKRFARGVNKSGGKNSARFMSRLIIKGKSREKKLFPVLNKLFFTLNCAKYEKAWRKEASEPEAAATKKRLRKCWVENYEVYETGFIVWSRQLGRSLAVGFLSRRIIKC